MQTKLDLEKGQMQIEKEGFIQRVNEVEHLLKFKQKELDSKLEMINDLESQVEDLRGELTKKTIEVKKVAG